MKDKFLIISKCGDELGIAKRIQDEGNDVKFYLADKRCKECHHGEENCHCDKYVEENQNVYQGIMEQVDDWEKEAAKDKNTVLVFGMVGMGKEADEYKKKGYPVFNASKMQDQLELERGFGLDVAGNHDIDLPESYDFQDYDKAKKFLADKDEEQGWVFKPEHNKEGVSVFVSTDRDEMIEMLDYYAEKWTDGVDFILQEVIDGCEVSSEAWFVNGVLIPNSYNNTWETKRFMSGNQYKPEGYSRNTGCMSSTVKFNACPKLYDETFKKLESWLKQQKYTGCLDINCIVSYDDEKPYMLEWTARMGYSAIYAFCEGLNMPISEFIAQIARGEMPKIEPSDEWLGALRVTIPPYPHSDEAPETEGLPVQFEESEHIWPLDVKIEDNKTKTSGFDGIILEVTGHNPDLDGLWEEIYELSASIKLPEKQIRTDVLENAEERINYLESIGYIDVS